MIERRRITTVDKLRVVVSQARCPLCGEKLGCIEGLDYDHVVPLALGGADTVENLQAVHRQCHKIKTAGPASTSAGGDIHKIAKVRRLSAKEEEFRRRLLAKDGPTAFLAADHEDRGARRSRWPSRPFPKRRPKP